ncbi:dienelactone hydrolase family protein [Ectothiorhodospiraceae bacterium BW-2]|nr:dienelactone hydrolase family protein [Ectothiorhodospiraceae bacterium BW-2]
MPGTFIELKTALDPLSAYVVGPEESKRALLILHEWWGVKPHNRKLADHFATMGYRVMIADLFDGRVTDSSEEASLWMRELNEQQDEVDEKLATAIDYLHQEGQRRVATYGCSMGGRQSLIASLNNPDKVDATVMVFCRMESNPDRLTPLQSPVLVVYAEQESNWPEKQQLFEAAMAKAGKTTEAISYDAAHGFTNPESSRYDSGADAAHLKVVEAFLARHLS